MRGYNQNTEAELMGMMLACAILMCAIGGAIWIADCIWGLF